MFPAVFVSFEFRCIACPAPPSPEFAEGSTNLGSIDASGSALLPDRVRDLYADLGAERKVFVDLACSSHNAMWEKNHILLFRASAEWLTKGSVNGMQEGMLKLGY